LDAGELRTARSRPAPPAADAPAARYHCGSPRLARAQTEKEEAPRTSCRYSPRAPTLISVTKAGYDRSCGRHCRGRLCREDAPRILSPGTPGRRALARSLPTSSSKGRKGARVRSPSYRHRVGAIAPRRRDPIAGGREVVRPLCDFGAAYTGPVSNTDEDDQPGRYMPTKEQLVRVPRGLTIEERQRFLRKDLDEMAGLKDTK
jgi:hypothetical protein